MRRRQKLMLAVLGLGLILGMWTLLSPESGTITQEQFDRLQTGMTQADVEELLGRSPQDEARYEATIWIPQPDGSVVSAFVSRGPWPGRFSFFDDAIDSQPQRIWFSKTGLIAVQFDNEGRLTDKYFSTVHLRNGPTVLDWLASRPSAVRQSLGL